MSKGEGQNCAKIKVKSSSLSIFEKEKKNRTAKLISTSLGCTRSCL